MEAEAITEPEALALAGPPLETAPGPAKKLPPGRSRAVLRLERRELDQVGAGWGRGRRQGRDLGRRRFARRRKRFFESLAQAIVIAQREPHGEMANVALAALPRVQELRRLCLRAGEAGKEPLIWIGRRQGDLDAGFEFFDANGDFEERPAQRFARLGQTCRLS